MLCPFLRVTTAFVYPGFLDNLPCLIFLFVFLFMILILVTLTLKIFSIFFLIVFLFAFLSTLKTVLFCSDNIVAFSVTTGNLIESIKLKKLIKR